MDYDQKVFAKQFPLVDKFTQHLIYHRTLKHTLSEDMLKVTFWMLTANAHLLEASNYWCMVFGSDGTNKTHWKNLSKNDRKLHDSFRDGLKPSTGMTYDEYREYWKEITDFRNNYSAHRALEFTDPVPSFDPALDVALYYDRWIRKVIHPDTIDERPLSTLVERFKLQAEAEITAIVEAVRSK